MSKKLIAAITTLALFGIVFTSVAVLSSAVNANRFNGLSPVTAHQIVDKSATGTLNPGDVEWHKFDLSVTETEISLTFISQMANQAPFISLSVHTQAEIDQWYAGQTSTLNGFGQLVTLAPQDQLVWNGQIVANQTYYVRVSNNSDFAIDYELRLDYTELPPVIAPQAVVVEEEVVEQAVAQAIETIDLTVGQDPYTPIDVTVAPHEVALQQGKIGAGDEVWFEMQVAQINGEARYPLDLTAFATPGDGNTRHKLHLDLFPMAFANVWAANQPDRIREFGAGRIVERDGDYVTSELIWNGVVNNDESFLVRFRNDNPFEVDYWLFTGDVIHNPAFAPVVEAQPVVHVEPGTDILHPETMVMGLNQGQLEPGQERWYEVMLSDRNFSDPEHLELTLYFTPNDGHRLHYVDMELYTAAQRAVWSRNDAGAMTNFGAGAIVQLDNNPETGELFWEGHLIDEARYYVKVANGSDTTIDFWLFTDEMPNVSLGELN